MEVNWLTVLNTALNIEVWIKGTWRVRKEWGGSGVWVQFLCFCSSFTPSSFRTSGLRNRSSSTPVWILVLEYHRLQIFLFICPSLISPCSLFFFFFSSRAPPSPPPISSLSYPIPSLFFFVVCLVSSGNNEGENYILAGTFQVARRWPLWSFFLSLFFFSFFLQRWKHQAAFAALRLCKSDGWCTPSEASVMMCLDCLDTQRAFVSRCVCACLCAYTHTCAFTPFSDNLNIIWVCSAGLVGWDFKVSSC